MFRRKDGSLNLSIQAIVILVMAMALLGLGLGFIRTIFASGGEKLIGEIDNINILQASDSQPIVSTNTVKVSTDSYAQLQVSAYNKDDTSTTPVYTINSVTCQGTHGLTISCPATIEIPLKEARSFGCSVTATTNTGLFACQITASATSGNSLAASFFVEVAV
jgi:hypothetical protein